MTESYNKKRVRVRTDNSLLYKKISKVYGYMCAICGWGLPTVTPNGNIQRQGGCDLHHITPYRMNGEHTDSNLILLCPNCHKLADTGIIPVDKLNSYVKRIEDESPQDWQEVMIAKYKKENVRVRQELRRVI